MNYEEYKALRAVGQVKAGIDKSDALGLIEYLPKRYQYASYFWSWVWILSIPIAIALIVFYIWWVGLIILVFVTPAVFSSTKESAAQFVLEYAEEDEDFFNNLIKNDLLVFRE